MTVKTFLLACFLHILLFIGLAIPEIARADLDKAIAYAEAGETCSSAYEYYQGAVGNRGVKFRPIKRWDYWFLKDDGNVVPCDLATYDIVSDREVLNLAGSGPVDFSTLFLAAFFESTNQSDLVFYKQVYS